MSDHTSAGAALRAAREDRGLTQEQIATAISVDGMSAPMLCRMEKGRHLTEEKIALVLSAIDALCPDRPVTASERLAVWSGFHRCPPSDLPAHLGLAHDTTGGVR